MKTYPTDPEAQRQWVEDSIASRLADLKAKFEGPKPKKDTNVSVRERSE